MSIKELLFYLLRMKTKVEKDAIKSFLDAVIKTIVISNST